MDVNQPMRSLHGRYKRQFIGGSENLQRNLLKSVFLLLLTYVSLFLYGCGSSEKIQKATGAKEVELPCNENKHRSDDEYFRARQSGKSPNLATAKKIALQNAKSELSGSIQSMMKRVTDQYTSQYDVGDDTEFRRNFQEESRTVVRQNLSNVRVICEQILQEQDGSYNRFVAIELNKEELLSGLNSRISNDEKLQIRYDEKKFEETFNEEMKKLKEEQP